MIAYVVVVGEFYEGYDIKAVCATEEGARLVVHGIKGPRAWEYESDDLFWFEGKNYVEIKKFEMML